MVCSNLHIIGENNEMGIPALDQSTSHTRAVYFIHTMTGKIMCNAIYNMPKSELGLIKKENKSSVMHQLGEIKAIFMTQ